MPQSHIPYPEEFRRQMVELVAVGRNPEELAKEFKVSGQSIGNWVKRAHLDAGKRKDGLTLIALAVMHLKLKVLSPYGANGNDRHEIFVTRRAG